MTTEITTRELWPGGSTKEQLRHYYRIGTADAVLDVGCGAMPFPLATHLADKYIKDSPSSFGDIPQTGLPVTQCSVESMPFRDKQFDFVYCTHVLEHVDDPAAACRELMRIGKRGYIECPRSWTEHIFSAEDHKWLVDHEEGILQFREKLPEERKDPLGIQFSLFELNQYNSFIEHWTSRGVRRIRNVEFYWEDNFDYRVIREEERNNAQRYQRFYEQTIAPMPDITRTAAWKPHLQSMLARVWASRNSHSRIDEADAETPSVDQVKSRPGITLLG